jgi:hypothetical protein
MVYFPWQRRGLLFVAETRLSGLKILAVDIPLFLFW